MRDISTISAIILATSLVLASIIVFLAHTGKGSSPVDIDSPVVEEATRSIEENPGGYLLELARTLRESDSGGM